MKPVLISGVLLSAVLLLLTACNKGGDEAARTQAQAEPAATESPAAPTEQAAADSSVATPTSWTGDAINFSFTTADGESRTAESYAGKPLVVNFWAAW